MTLATLAQAHPRLFDWGIRVDRAPAAGWLALQALALAPLWMGLANPVDALGLALLAALGARAWTLRRDRRTTPRLGWLAIAAAATLAATLLHGVSPWAANGSGLLALGAAALALLPRGHGWRLPAGPALLHAYFANRFVGRVAYKVAFALTMVLCLAWSAGHF
jgi:hypothetical protein